MRPRWPGRFSADYLDSTGFFQNYDHPTEGLIVMTSIPQHFSRSPGTVRRLPPNLGEHGEEILMKAGFTREEALKILNSDSDAERSAN